MSDFCRSRAISVCWSPGYDSVTLKSDNNHDYNVMCAYGKPRPEGGIMEQDHVEV